MSTIRESSAICHPGRVDACMDAGGTIPGMESVESSRDAYTDVGGRKRPEQVFEQRPRKRLEHVFEGSLICIAEYFLCHFIQAQYK